MDVCLCMQISWMRVERRDWERQTLIYATRRHACSNACVELPTLQKGSKFSAPADVDASSDDAVTLLSYTTAPVSYHVTTWP